MSAPDRDPDDFDQWIWTNRILEEKAYKAMLDAAIPITESEYNALGGKEYSMVPLGKLGFVKIVDNKVAAIRTGSFFEVDIAIYQRVLTDETDLSLADRGFGV